MHIKAHEFIFDILASWESRDQPSPLHSGSGSGSSRGSKAAPAAPSPENRFLFYRRHFRGSREMSEDPAEVSLLYGQAINSVVERDDFPINDKVALQLAGLQLQVALGDPQSGESLVFSSSRFQLSIRTV